LLFGFGSLARCARFFGRCLFLKGGALGFWLAFMARFCLFFEKAVRFWLAFEKALPFLWLAWLCFCARFLRLWRVALIMYKAARLLPYPVILSEAKYPQIKAWISALKMTFNRLLLGSLCRKPLVKSRN